ncbi:DEAD/DEAH box helicase [Acinetobacter sp. TR3]|uniref:DEAD/DEAH box helicase n=1 Tax=Acinetobacter sp. TR3 TaxID=3003392 RepID=UPI0022ABF007|nr:DEAD/DEAH box helicase [Acinetobacter sp. TR3]WAU77582.1 DEAD/DEAH box helicase [Acinetobacter sp. TR3]
MYKYFSSLTQESIQKNKEATLSILGISHPELRDVLGQQMSQFVGEDQSFLSSPVIEQMFAWEKGQPTLDALGGELLHKKVIDALDHSENGAYRFNRNYQPYVHQLQSWNALLEDKKSIVVTSGTGSGKTECFMVPILNDLYEEFIQAGQSLTGVHALFLYPLNALINSQQERLDAWMRHFLPSNAIRYCLYNGNTPEHKSQKTGEQTLHPNQVFTREELRTNPAPILVTNGTMLEYMMVRQIDAPILQKSQGKLRWIVLDEAHSYMGSQAAELAMQLRRVLHAFGVEAKDVRFVATSATIAGADAEEKLKQFLSEISGQSTENILVIGGQREVPVLPVVENHQQSFDELVAIDAQQEISYERYQRLAGHPIACVLRESICSQRALTLEDLFKITREKGFQLSQHEILEWLDLLTYTKPSDEEQAFLKIRVNYYQRVTHGLWSCINDKCNQKDDDLKNWSFGQVYATHQENCACGAPVLELTFCKSCKEPHLLGLLGREDVLKQWTVEVEDEFALLIDNETEEQEEREFKNAIKNRLVVFSSNENKEKNYRRQQLNLDNLKLGQISKNALNVHYFEPHNSGDPVECSNPECGSKGTKYDLPFRRAILGAPYYITQTVPHLLQYCPDIDQNEIDEASKNFSDPEFIEGEFKELKDCTPWDMPAKGKRLITFTDSRQGTARLSVKMQQEAERSRLRGAVVKILIEHTKKAPQQTVNPAEATFRQLLIQAEKDGDIKLINICKEQLEGFAVSNNALEIPEMTWDELCKLIAKDFDFRTGILLANRHIAGEVFDDAGPLKLAQMLLTREFSRRPKNANSLETLGLVKVNYQGLKDLSDLPNYWKEQKLSIQDWQDFIKVVLDYYIRENTVIDLAEEWKQWMGGPVRPKHVVTHEDRDKFKQRDDGSKNNSILAWPMASVSKNHRLVKLLVLGAKLDLSLQAHRNIADDWLKKAWQVLKDEFLVKDGNSKYHLRKEKLTFSLLDKVFLCPITHRLIDTTFKGFTPYLPISLPQNTDKYKTEEMAFPKLWNINTADLTELHQDSAVQKLRSLNLWTDLSDNAVLGGFFYRTAEHSAQQSANLLKQYETYFKAGKVNVLNCSTTMEMGVDIGGISTVVMNNVPPHPANYLQRTGRAGRGSQSRAISYTICKNNPHDQQVFKQPLWAYNTAIQAPHVSFNSQRLIQRHINAQLLAIFLIKEIGETDIDRPKLDLKWFYLKQDGQSDSICDTFEKWLVGKAVKDYQLVLEFLKKGTALKDIDNAEIIDACVTKIRELKIEWLEEYVIVEREYQQELATNPNSSYLYRLTCEKYRLTQAYLLSELAMRNFLPSYGFPTDVITFDNTNKLEKDRWDKLSKSRKTKDLESRLDREDNLSRVKGLPSRNIAIAIREYAPGAEVIVDGRVYTSRGISLAWQNIHNEHDKKPQKFDYAWMCHHCGQTGLTSGVLSNEEQLICTNIECGEIIKDVKKVLRPNGFSVDFYDKPNNDVTMQKYIPVQIPWVGLSETALSWSLPHANLGYFNVDPNGHVFQYSSGLNGTGFAICMQCGRADSMEESYDGEVKFPITLTPDRPHKALKAQKDGDKFKRPDCGGSSVVKSNIHLGCQIKTDVLEIVLKHPNRNEYILKSEEGTIIATTLVVALRQAIATKLGIAADELGYGIKVKKIDDKAVLVLQIFDDLSGGAGFSTTAANYITEVLRLLIEKLHCVDDSCNSVCGKCLLDNQTRHDIENLDRTLALAWLGDDFLTYLDSPIANTDFIAGTPFSIIEQYVNHGATQITFNLTGNSEDWDVLCTAIRKKLFKFLNSNIKLVGVVSLDMSLTPQIQQEMLALEKMGISFTVNSNITPEYLYVQIVSQEKVITLYNQSTEVSCFNEFWLEGQSPSYKSITSPELQLQKFSFDFKAIESYENEFQQIKVGKDFDGESVNDFAEKFWAKVLPISKLHDLVNDEVIEIEYSDRYLQSPANIILITSLLKGIKKLLAIRPRLTITTCFRNKQIQDEKLYSDFSKREVFDSFFINYFEDQLSQKLNLQIPDSKIDHARFLLFRLKSGKKIELRLDQGVGFWQIKYIEWPKVKEDRDFPFNESFQKQLLWVKRQETNLCVRSEENFKTDLYITKS